MPDRDTNARAVVLIAHGSRAAGANAAHQELCDAVARSTGVAVRAAFLELADPTFADAVDAAVRDGATRIDVLPHFLHPGNHTVRDIPELVAIAAAAHPGVAFQQLPHTGGAPGLVGLLGTLVQDVP